MVSVAERPRVDLRRFSPSQRVGELVPIGKGIEATCLMICMSPNADTLETRRSAELTGVSINGSGGLQEEVGNA